MVLSQTVFFKQENVRTTLFLLYVKEVSDVSETTQVVICVNETKLMKPNNRKRALKTDDIKNAWNCSFQIKLSATLIKVMSCFVDVNFTENMNYIGRLSYERLCRCSFRYKDKNIEPRNFIGSFARKCSKTVVSLPCSSFVSAKRCTDVSRVFQ